MKVVRERSAMKQEAPTLQGRGSSLLNYGELVPEFSGCRKHRSLYVSKDGFAVNVDVNTSLNIG
jgi:hypothetical protein